MPETKRCPFCAEEIQYEAIKCKHCGEWLKEAPQSKEDEELLSFNRMQQTIAISGSFILVIIGLVIIGLGVFWETNDGRANVAVLSLLGIPLFLATLFGIFIWPGPDNVH